MSSEESTYLRRLKAWLARDPDSRLFLSLAEEYWKNDVTDVAIGIAEEGLKKHPDLTAARCCLASWYLAKDRPLDAELQLSEIVEKCPDLLSAQRLLARLRRRLGKTNEALAGYRNILARRPQDAESLGALQELSAEALPGEVVVTPHEEAGRGTPGTALPVLNRGRLAEADSAFARGQHSQAFELYSSVLSERPDLWQIVRKRDEALTMHHAAQRERKRRTVNRLGRLRDAVRTRYDQAPTAGLPPVSG
jgi:tetratricopeptide (TPR) repeat protein